MYVNYKKYAIMVEEGDFMAYSRVEKYKELRDGLKDEAGINRERVVEDEKIEDSGEDDFLSFIKKDDTEPHKSVDLEDTLTEAKTFEQMRQEGSKELEQALRSAKKGVGKESQYNTRMDILSKIREPEKAVIKIDSVDEYKTDEFARGMFLNEDKEEEKPVEEEKSDSKKKMTLMEKLASISPEEDAKKAQEFLQENKDEEVIEKEETDQQEERDEPEIEQTEEFEVDQMEDDVELVDHEDKKAKKDSKLVKLLDVIIIILVILLFVLFGIIIYQNFF